MPAALEAAVIGASRGKGLVLMLQPIHDLSDGSVAYYEALLRIESDAGLISPALILPVARELGVSAALDASVLHAGAKLTETMGPISVNVVSVASALPTLALYQSCPLTLEVSERDPSLRNGTLPHYLSQLKQLGFNAMLDDFGEGDLRHEHLLDGLSGIKLDISLTRLLAADDLAAAALKAMLATIRNAGLTVVAEGIETAADLKAVQGIATHGQGWHFSRPVRPCQL